MLTILSLPGFDTALVQSVGQGYDMSLPLAARKKFVFSILGSVVLGGFALYYLFIGNTTIAFTLLISLVFYPFLYSFSVYSSFLATKKLFARLAGVAAFSSMGFLLSISLSIFILPTTFGITLGYLIGITIPSVLGYWYALRFIKNKQRIDQDLGSYGSFITLISVLPWIVGFIGNIILDGHLGPESLALYSVAIGFLISVQKNCMVFYKPVTAQLAHQTAREHSKILHTHFIKFFTIGALLTLALWITAPFLAIFFFPLYPEAIIYTRLLSLALFPLPIAWILNDMVLYQKNKRAQVFTSFVPPIIQMLLYFFVIPLWGIGGLIAVFLLDRYTAPIISLWYLFFDKRSEQS